MKMNTKSQRRNFKRLCQNFSIGSENELRFKGKKGSLKVLHKEKLVEALNRHHTGFGSAHHGKNATINSISSEFYWPTITKDVAEFVKSCDRCQKNRCTNTDGPSLHPIPVSTRIFYRWGIDLAGPFAESNAGNRYICVAVEYTTRWPEAAAIPTKHACHVSKFVHNLICRYGVMSIMMSDQGREFCNDIMDTLGKELRFQSSSISGVSPSDEWTH